MLCIPVTLQHMGPGQALRTPDLPFGEVLLDNHIMAHMVVPILRAKMFATSVVNLVIGPIGVQINLREIILVVLTAHLEAARVLSGENLHFENLSIPTKARNNPIQGTRFLLARMRV